MSHFTVLVIAPKGTKNIQSYLHEVLAPFDENMEVEEYEKECYCVGLNASKDAREKASLEFKPQFDALHSKFPNETPFNASKEFEAAFDDLQAKEQAFFDKLLAADPRSKIADPKCDDCKGTGIRSTTYNPDSKWDWYSIGGRWSGMFQGQVNDANTPAVFQNLSMDEKDNVATGKQVKKLAQNPDFGTFAILTKGGQWLEKGKMGWWACVSDKDKDYSAKAADVYQSLEDDDVCILVDCHI